MYLNKKNGLERRKEGRLIQKEKHVLIKHELEMLSEKDFRVQEGFYQLYLLNLRVNTEFLLPFLFIIHSNMTIR